MAHALDYLPVVLHVSRAYIDKYTLGQSAKPCGIPSYIITTMEEVRQLDFTFNLDKPEDGIHTLLVDIRPNWPRDSITFQVGDNT